MADLTKRDDRPKVFFRPEGMRDAGRRTGPWDIGFLTISASAPLRMG